MRFQNHMIIAGCIGAAAGAPPEGMAGLVVGSVFPDKADFKMSFGSEFIFRQIHRGVTHWPWPYFAAFAALLTWPSTWHPLLRSFLLWATLGCIVHILSDMLTPGGIPWHPASIKKKLSMKLFKTGSLKEYAFTWLILGCTVLGLILVHELSGYAPWKGYTDLLLPFIQ